MRIDKQLHLVIPIYADPEDGGDLIAQVHSTPLSEEVVDRYHSVLGRMCTKLLTQGRGIIGGQGHAMRELRDAAQAEGTWFDDPKVGRIGVERGLVEEIRRLTMVAALDKDGRWEQLPLAVAVDRGVLTRQDKAEVENAIVFFIAVYATLPRAQRRPLLESAAEIWGAQITSSPFTEWTTSLKTSTQPVNTGESAPAPASGAPASANAIVGGKLRSVPV